MRQHIIRAEIKLVQCARTPWRPNIPPARPGYVQELHTLQTQVRKLEPPKMSPTSKSAPNSTKIETVGTQKKHKRLKGMYFFFFFLMIIPKKVLQINNNN